MTTSFPRWSLCKHSPFLQSLGLYCQQDIPFQNLKIWNFWTTLAWRQMERCTRIQNRWFNRAVHTKDLSIPNVLCWNYRIIVICKFLILFLLWLCTVRSKVPIFSTVPTSHIWSIQWFFSILWFWSTMLILAFRLTSPPSIQCWEHCPMNLPFLVCEYFH